MLSFSNILVEVRQVHRNDILSVAMVMEQVCIVLLGVKENVPSSESICPCVLVPLEE